MNQPMERVGNRRINAGLRSLLCLIAIASFCWAGCSNKSVSGYLAAGDQAMHANQLATAEQNYSAAVKLAPNDPKTHLALGRLYVYEHNYTPAEAEFIRAINLAPRDASAHADLARLYASRNKREQAQDQWRAAIALAPGQTAYYRELAQLLMQQKQLAAAERELRIAVGLAPQDAHLHLELAEVLAAQPGRQAQADAEYAMVRKLDPSLLPTAAAPSATAGATGGGAMALAPTPAPAPASIRPINNKRFLLSHDSPVYREPDDSSAIVARVHRRKFVIVTGITGNWLRIRLRNGVVGFIPTKAVE